MSTVGPIPALITGLVDDAAIFPPGSMPLTEAVEAHGTHLGTAHAGLVGPFIVDLARLDALAGSAPPGFEVSVVVPDPGGIQAAVERAATGGLRLLALEVKLDASDPEEQLAAVVAAAPPGVAVFVEAPRPSSPHWPAVLAGAAREGLSLKFRTGGTAADAFPSEQELARWIGDAVGAAVPFKCTAGLHRAARYRDPRTGFEHHGYLNILLATATATAAARAGSGSEVAAALAERDGRALAAAIDHLSADERATARGAFVSYGSCSIDEPLEDLHALGLLPSPAGGDPS